VFFDQSLTIKDRNFLKHQNCPSKNEKNDFYEQQQLAFVTCILNKLEIFFKVFLIGNLVVLQLILLLEDFIDLHCIVAQELGI